MPRTPPTKQRAHKRPTIPRPNDAFVGRATELAELERLLADGATIVTVVGPAGIGKTRLTLEWARSNERALLRSGAGLVFCDLADARDLDDACAALSRVLDVPLATGESASEAVEHLGRALGDLGAFVVILDNMEQIAAVAPTILEPLLAAAPHAQFVVTSRERLRLRAERFIDLEALVVPSAGERETARIAESDAVLLFVARSRSLSADFELSETDAPLVADIVRRLDGIPLAIELCAARMGVLGPAQIVERLAHRFDLLAAGSRGAPPRQATLRGAIAWSWDLLDSREQDVLSQCAVFRGGFSLEAAEGVIAIRASDASDEASSVLDALQSLHDKSLVRVVQKDAIGTRFGLFESLREFAEEKLALSLGTADAMNRHATFFLGARGSSLPRVADLRKIARDVDNVSVACERVLGRLPLTPDDADTALRGLLLLEPVLLTCARGRLEPFVAMLDVALAAAAVPADPVVFARALHVRAIADLLRGRILDAVAGFRRALEAARAAGSRLDEGLALTKLGLLFEHGDASDEARAYFEQARAIVGELRNPGLEGDYLLMRGGALTWLGRASEAAAHHELACSKLKVAGDLRAWAMASAQLALARLNEGRLDDAAHAAVAALDVLDDIDEQRTRGYVLGVLARTHQAAGRLDEAREHLVRALAIHVAVGDRWSEAIHLGYLGNLAFEERRYADASREYAAAIPKLRASGESHYASIYLAALGAVMIAEGRDDEARTQLTLATRELAGVRVFATKMVVALHGEHAEIARARHAAASGDIETAIRHRSAAAARIAAADAPAPDGSPAPVRCSEDTRFAVRMLSRALAESMESVGGASVSVEVRVPSARTLVVGPEARWFRVGDSEPVNMLKARAARLILARLVRVRLDKPGSALRLGEIFDAGWPGERVADKAAANRVYVTLSKLKSLGLRGFIQSRDDGFLLDPQAILLESLSLDDAARD